MGVFGIRYFDESAPDSSGAVSYGAMSGDESPDFSGDWSERCNIWGGICIYIGVTNYTNHETEEETEEAANYGGRLYAGQAQSGSDGRDFRAREAGFIHGAPQIKEGL